MNYVYTLLVVLALGAAQILIGGARLLYSLPAYLVIAVAASLTVVESLRAQRNIASVTCVLSTLLFSGYLAARAWQSPVDYLARPDLFCVAAALLVYLIGTLFVSQARVRLVLVASLLLFALAHVAVGSIQFKYANQYMALPWIWRLDTSARATGFYISGNHLAGMLEVMVAFAAAIVFWGRAKIWWKIPAAFCLLLCLAGIAMSGSRGGYVSTLAVLSTLLLFSLMAVARLLPQRFWLLLPVTVATGAVLVAGTVYLSYQSDYLRSRFQTIYEPGNMRLHMWRAAMQQFSLNQLYGTGSGTYLYYGRQFRDPSVQHDPIHVHNDYLELLAEYGIIGAGLGALFLLCHLWNGFRTFLVLIRDKLPGSSRARSDILALTLAALAAVAGYIVHSVVDFNLHLPANALLMAFVFAVLANPGVELQPDDRGSRAWILAGVRACIPILGAFLVVIIPPLLPAEYFAERARAALRDNQYEEAVAFADESRIWDRKNPETYYYSGEAHRLAGAISDDIGIRLDRFETALRDFKAALALFPNDLRSLIKAGVALDDLAEPAEAAKYFLKGLAIDPNSARAHAYYGLHLQMSGRLAEAEVSYKRALELDGTDILARAGLEDVAHLSKQPVVPEEDEEMDAE